MTEDKNGIEDTESVPGEQTELWKKIDTEAEMLRRRTTPVHLKQQIMDALPEKPPVPWHKKIFGKGS